MVHTVGMLLDVSCAPYIDVVFNYGDTWCRHVPEQARELFYQIQAGLAHQEGQLTHSDLA